MLRELFLATIFFRVLAYVNGNQHYVFAPQIIREGTYENVVVSLHGVSGKVKIVASVNLAGVIHFTYDNQSAAKPIIVPIKYDRNNAPRELGKTVYAEITITVTQGNEKVFQTNLKVQVIYVSGYLYVQTDRPIYRPEEIVRFRVAALTNSYVPDRNRTVKVVVRIPLEKVGVSEKLYRMSQNTTFIEDSYKLPEYPVFGIWSIEAKFEDQDGEWSKREFAVRRYVLPTFNVRIIMDQPFILVKDIMTNENITGTITAEYSYGKKVYGNYFIAATLKRPNSERAISFYQYPDFQKQARLSRIGVTRFRINTTTILNAFKNGSNVNFETLKNEGATVTIQASVTGRDDGTTESDKSMPLPFVDSPYIVKIDRMSKYFTRGTVFEIKADVLDSVTAQPVQSVPLIFKGPHSCVSQRCPDEQCADESCQCVSCSVVRRVSSDENGQINFKINMDGSNKSKTYTIESSEPTVAQENQALVEFTLHPYESTNILQLSVEGKIATVGDPGFQIQLRYLQAPTEIRYIILARGRFVATGCDQPLPDSTEHIISITIRSDMVPSFRLFVYYMVGKEMVSNSLWVDVKDACKEEIEVSVPNTVLPGEWFEVEYKGSKNALIGVSAVDRAAYFLYGDSRLTRNSLFKGLNQYDRGCVSEGGKDAKHVFEVAGFQVVSNSKPFLAKDEFEPCVVLSRKKRAVEIATFEEESVDPACETDGMIEHLTDEDCATRADRVRDRKGKDCAEAFLAACEDFQFYKRFARTSARSVGGNAERQKALIATTRLNFEESMLWSTEILDSDGKLTLRVPAKHSITTFEFDTVSMHPEDGFCVAETQNMTIIKNVFIQLHVPYTLKRREQTEIRVSLFNYAKETQKIWLEVMTGKDICSHFPEGEFRELSTVDILPNSAAGFNFVVLPLRIPRNDKVQIEAKAFGTGEILLDHIIKSITVEPEGEMREIKGTRSFEVKANMTDEFSFNLTFPVNFVPETRQCWLYTFTNFMGPIIQFDPVTKQPKADVHSIIRKPTGCGEQTMVKMGPNVYVHKYLVTVGRMAVNSTEHTESINHMSYGFANEMTYRCTNCFPKVWAVFTGAKPSVWLNAYVNKVFAQAKEFYTTMNTDPICASVGWLSIIQNANGSFPTVRRVGNNRMHGAVGSELTLTAYVLMSLAESKSLCEKHSGSVKQAIKRAIGYLEAQKNHTQLDQPYAIALITYAMTIADTNHAYSKEMRAQLLTIFQYSDDKRLAFLKGAPLADILGTGAHAHWYRIRPLAIDIEATGYALLALVKDAEINGADQQRFDLTRKIVLWLIEQRDHSGGFETTQDTVVGLEALANYMIWSSKVQPNKDPTKIRLTISSPPGTELHHLPRRLLLDESYENVTKQISVPSLTVAGGIVNVKAEGKGEGTISYRCVYRTLVNEEPCHFNLSVSAVSHQDSNTGGSFGEKPVSVKLSIKVSKSQGLPAGQSIVETTLISGYEADEKSLAKLSEESYLDGIIKRYEISNHKVIMYLEKITDKDISLAFLIKRKNNVKDPQPASVTVYSYYEPSVLCTEFYALPKNVPQLRTTPCKDDRGQGSEDMCKCAEGGCMKCRTRKEQLSKTFCIPPPCKPCKKRKCKPCKEIVKDCSICDKKQQSNCTDLRKMACDSSYVYIVNVTEGVMDRTGVFAGFKARIETKYKTGSDTTVKDNDERDFVTRTDCYDTCKDDILEKRGRIDAEKIFHVPGRRMLIMGHNVEKGMDKNDQPLIRYNLKEGDYAERVYPKEKCKSAGKFVKNNCKGKKKNKSEKRKKRCRSNQQIVQSCTNLVRLYEAMNIGCDALFF